MLILSIMQFQFQCNELLRKKQNLKYAADEAAASAALCFDEASFGSGVFRFDRTAAREKAAKVISLNLPEEQGESIRWELTFSDERQDHPYVEVTIRQERLRAVSVYEYVGF